MTEPTHIPRRPCLRSWRRPNQSKVMWKQRYTFYFPIWSRLIHRGHLETWVGLNIWCIGCAICTSCVNLFNCNNFLELLDLWKFRSVASMILFCDPECLLWHCGWGLSENLLGPAVADGNVKSSCRSWNSSNFKFYSPLLCFEWDWTPPLVTSALGLS